MTNALKHVLSQAMALAPEDRIELAETLLELWEPSTDPEYVAAWEAEIEKRLNAHERGESKAISWEEARKKIFGDEGADV